MSPDKKAKLLELKKKLDTLQPVDNTFKDSFIAQELSSISDRLKSNPTIKTLQKFNADLSKLQTEIQKFKADFDLSPIQQSIRNLQKELKQGDFNLQKEFEAKLQALPNIPDLTSELEALKTEFNQRINAIPKDDDSALQADLDNLKQQLQDLVSSDIEEDKQEKAELEKQFATIRQEINKRLANLGGGQASPQLLVGGNQSKNYRDINLKAGSNVTLTLTDNNTTKRSEITIAATGGSGSGIVRSINSISTPTTAGATSTTDYVYIATSALTLTLPTAVGNTNLYTAKNVSTGTLTIAFNGIETCDGQTTLILPVQYTSIDLESDGANWIIT